MKQLFHRALSLFLSLALLCALAVPALASPALGDDLTAVDTPLHQQTQLSTNVFWSTTYSDYRTENLITYTPNTAVTPIVTYGGVLTDRSTVSNTAQALENQGWRVVAGINGDFYNVNNGLPIGIVVTQGRLRSSDGGYHAIGFRADGTAVLGRPGVRVSASYSAQDGTGLPRYDADGNPLLDELGNPVLDGTGQAVDRALSIAAVNKARTEAGIFLYTYDFNAAHTTGSTQPGVDVVCTVPEGEGLTIGASLTVQVERVLEASSATALAPNQIVLSANAKAGEEVLASLRAIPAGTALTLTLTPSSASWNDVAYAVGALYSLVENGAVAPGLPGGAAPRTAIGQRYDGSLIFYTIDGRKSGHSIGATMSQVAQRLVELGCVTALCLDGGGSTTLSATQPTAYSAKRVNTPSDGGERAVSNQVFLVATNQPSGQLSHFYVSAAHNYVLAGSSAAISAAAIDTNFIPMESGYDLFTSAGTIDGGVLVTPLEGGDITVTAQGPDGQGGSTIVHAIANPDGVAIRNDKNTILSSLNVSPGTSVQLQGSAAYHHLPLKADPAAFTWTVEGNIGTIDASGLFTAGTPGKGRIIVSAGGQSEGIDVTVSDMALETVEDFEGEKSSFDGVLGENLEFRLDTATVQAGRGSGRLDYQLDPAGQAVWHFFAPLQAGDLYTQLNLWIYGDASGNTLSFLCEDGQQVPVAVLDFQGWKQVSLEKPAAAIQGVALSGSGSGTVYLDQLTASYNGILDTAAPVITAQLNQAAWTVTGTVSDAVDGVLPAEAVTIRLSGASAGEYDPASGTFTVALPASGESRPAYRVTVTAKDSSGNIGRASVDIPAQGQTHRFTDVNGYWGADYADFLYDADITKGYEDGTFRPNQNVTRAQFSVMLYRYLKLDEAKYAGVELPFADLASIPDYALPAIRALYTEGIVNGSAGADGQIYFHPSNSLTRAQAAAMIGRTQDRGYVLADLSFTDAAEIPGYAEYYIRALAAQGVISGYSDGSFRPQANITRGQMAKILYNLM